MMSQVWIYELPEQLDDRATPNPQAAIQAQLIRSLRASPYLASEPSAASSQMTHGVGSLPSGFLRHPNL